MKKILVLCTGNSCRSQMAEGYIRHFAKDKATVLSAGIETHGVNVRAIKSMAEDGIDISNHTSTNVNEYIDIPFDYVITVCDNANEHCPFFPIQKGVSTVRIHHNFPDPAKATGNEEEIMDQFRITRIMIKNYCKDFVLHNLK